MLQVRWRLASSTMRAVQWIAGIGLTHLKKYCIFFDYRLFINIGPHFLQKIAEFILNLEPLEFFFYIYNSFEI